MLLSFEVTSSTGAKDYFAASLSPGGNFTRQDYYSEGQESPGIYGGKLGVELGLAGKRVDETTFHRLCDNRHPTEDKPLTPRTNDYRRVCYDFTFSGPKSFSIVEAFASDDERRQLRQAFADAVSETVAGDIEPDMQTRERKNGADHDITTGNVLTAAFPHATARPEDDAALPDMHWHMHLLVWNATRRADDGKIKAGQFGNIIRDKPYYRAAFYARLAEKLEGLGYAIERRGGTEWEIAGVPQSMIDLFSKRTSQIEGVAKQRGITAAARKAELGAKTRAKKQKELTLPELRAAWWSQLSDGDRDALAKVYGKEILPSKEVTAREAIGFAIDHLSEQLSAFPERELMRVALLHGLGSVTPEQVAAELPRQGVIVDEIDGRRMATTDELQEEERYIARIAGCGRGSVCPVGVPDGLSRTMEDGKRLNDGQWQAATGLLDSSNRVNLVEGPAGAGKSSMLGKFDEGMRRQGESVTYLASSSDATGVLAKDGFEVNTVARFLLDEKMQAAAAGGRVVIDETSLLGHKDAVRLLQVAEKHDLKLIFVGDPMQHGSVPRGAFMRVLKDFGCLQSFRLTEILRQETPQYRAAAGLLSEGKSLEGFKALDAMGWVKEMGEDAARVAAIASDYMQALNDRASCLVVSPTHGEASAITAAIRGKLREAGKLDAGEHEFTRLVATNASQAQRGQALTYRPGDVIQFHQNAKGFTKGDRLTISDPAAVPLGLADKFTVYRPEKIVLAVGDRIRFTGNVATKDGGTLKNGENHSVAEITSSGSIRLDNGKVIAGDAGHFRYGFVDTSFASQGKTVKRVILAMSSRSLPATNAEQLYVSASRGKQSVTLYTDDKIAVASAVGRSSQKFAALDLKSDRQKEEEKHLRRLEDDRQHRLRLAYMTRQRANFPTLHPDRPGPGGGSRLPAWHAARLLAEGQGRDMGYGR